MVGLPDGEKMSKISLFVLTQLTNVTDTQTETDTQTPHDGIGRAYASHRAAIMARFDRPRMNSYSSSVVAMAVSCTAFGKTRYWPKKTPIFHTPLYLTCTIPKKPFKFLPKILTQTVRVHKLLGGANIIIAEKFKS